MLALYAQKTHVWYRCDLPGYAAHLGFNSRKAARTRKQLLTLQNRMGRRALKRALRNEITQLDTD